MRPSILAVAVMIATLAFALSPLLTTGFNGFTPDQFPVPQDNPPVQPAGYTFSIWGVIYLWLIISAVFGVIVANLPASNVPVIVLAALGIAVLTFRASLSFTQEAPS